MDFKKIMSNFRPAHISPFQLAIFINVLICLKLRANIPTEKANFPNCDSNHFNDNIVGYILPAESIRVLTNPLRDDQVYVIDIFFHCFTSLILKRF